MTDRTPWYGGKNSDVLFYLLVAIFFLELIVGGVSFFYGIMHAAPVTPGGPPIARFPWLAWVISAFLAPVALILLVHLSALWLSPSPTEKKDEKIPESMNRFYACVRQAPAIVVLVAILALGATLFFVDGAIAWLGKFSTALVPYIPWLAVCCASLVAFCFLAHTFFAYRRRKLEQEYAWRREVLARTGIVLTDAKSRALPTDAGSVSSSDTISGQLEKGDIVEIQPLPPGKRQADQEE